MWDVQDAITVLLVRTDTLLDHVILLWVAVALLLIFTCHK